MTMTQNDKRPNGFTKYILSIVVALIVLAVPAIIMIYARQQVVLSRLEQMDKEIQQLKNRIYYGRGADIY